MTDADVRRVDTAAYCDAKLLRWMDCRILFHGMSSAEQICIALFASPSVTKEIRNLFQPKLLAKFDFDAPFNCKC